MNLMEAYGITNLLDLGFFSDVFGVTFGTSDAFPFLEDERSASLIDYVYYFKRSGDKYVSDLISKVTDTELTGQQRVAIAEAFVKLYGDSIIKAWNAYTASYDVTAPYHIAENTQYEHTGGSSMNYDGTIADAHTGTVTDVATAVTSDTTIYGFQADGKPSSSTKDNGTTTRTHGDTITKTFNNSNTGEDSANDKLGVTKSGNLGVTDTSTLISREIELRNLNFFNNTLFPLVDKFLTLPIY